MMMTHRIVLKTHPLLATHVRSVHSILFRSGLQRRSPPKGAASEENAKPAVLPSIVLPIPSLTPGALNPKVKQATIKKTICKSGWTKTIRPPVSYTNTLKIEQMVLYGETGLTSEYEEDHFIPLASEKAPLHAAATASKYLGKRLRSSS